MRLLRDDTYSRRGRDNGEKRSNQPGALLFTLIFASLVLLVLSKLNHGFVRDFRAQIADLIAPALTIAAVPIQPLRRLPAQVKNFFDMNAQLRRLKQENARLQDGEWRMRELQRRMSRLGKLVKIVKEQPLDHVSARVIADASGPFVRIALINAGTVNGVSSGFPVINAQGLVGRIEDAGRSVSRLMLLSDLNSRVPVLIGRQGKRALLLGDNNAAPRLAYLAQDKIALPGEDVYTSGIGGMFPAGLRIGTVRGTGGRRRVDLYARFDELEYVSVLFYRSPIVVRSSIYQATSSTDRSMRALGLVRGPRRVSRKNRTKRQPGGGMIPRRRKARAAAGATKN